MLDAKTNSPIPFLESEIEGSIDQRFQLVARRVPDHIAVNTLVDQLTYAVTGNVGGGQASPPTPTP